MTVSIPLWEAALLFFAAMFGAVAAQALFTLYQRSQYERQIAEITERHAREIKSLQDQLNALQAEVRTWAQVAQRAWAATGGGMEIHAGESVVIGGDAAARDRISTGGPAR